MKIFVINPGSTSTKIALFIDEKPVWAAGAHHTADDLSEFHHVNEQYAYRKDFVLRLLAEADIPLDFDAVIARGGLLKPTPRQGVCELPDEQETKCQRESLKTSGNRL